VLGNQIQAAAPGQKGEVFGLVDNIIEVFDSAFDVVHFFLEEGEVGHNLLGVWRGMQKL